ncbi:Gfo/Idh/MocA family protein [Paenibacillus albus]|uniref:Gfo/Idh/MocA family oxidoreductase n=1 Tax=Paenibacillus albus TaxID=2495582 RepID=A0A3S8ZZW7_9BACL|nr:Gfo/Idh/MocA family oxidoreductase [Paenibacillus albus]AZN39008.1 Gfo/Idh/MocA family oxidoreductase [Paenibacillus albus]
MNTIKTAAVGLGVMGQNMIHNNLYKYPDDIVLVAVCESNKNTLRAFAESNPDVRTYSDYRELLDNEKVDLLYIAVPPSKHHEVVHAALRKQIHVFCEKPLANSLEEAKSMLDAAVQAEVLHAMHFMMPLFPGSLKLQKLVEEGAIGLVTSIDLILQFPQWPRAWQNNPWIASKHEGGFLLEVGIHWIHLIQTIFGPITHVQSNVSYPADAQASEVEAEATLTLHNGMKIHLTGTTRAEKERVSMVVHGDKGKLALENWSNLFMGEAEDALQAVPVQDADGQLPVIGHVIRRLRGQQSTIFDFNDGYRAQLILEALRNPVTGGVFIHLT